MWPFSFISESTWGYPIVAGAHVLAIGLFGGTVLVADDQLRVWKRIGFAVVMLTGLLIFASNPARYYNSTFFRIKMLLLLLAAVNAFAFRSRLSAYFSLALWTAIIFASRFTAF